METNAFPSLKMTENAAFPIIYRYAAHWQSALDLPASMQVISGGATALELKGLWDTSGYAMELLFNEDGDDESCR
jgi:hypothetical protein